MMKIRLCTLKCLVILLGVASLMIIAGRNLYQESFVTEDSNIFKETQVAKQFFNPLGMLLFDDSNNFWLLLDFFGIERNLSPKI